MDVIAFKQARQLGRTNTQLAMLKYMRLHPFSMLRIYTGSRFDIKINRRRVRLLRKVKLFSPIIIYKTASIGFTAIVQLDQSDTFF